MHVLVLSVRPSESRLSFVGYIRWSYTSIVCQLLSVSSFLLSVVRSFSTVRLSVRPCVRLSIRPNVRPLVRPSVHPSERKANDRWLRPFVHSSVFSAHLPINIHQLFINPSIGLSSLPSVRPSIHPSVMPFVRPFVLAEPPYSLLFAYFRRFRLSACLSRSAYLPVRFTTAPTRGTPASARPYDSVGEIICPATK